MRDLDRKIERVEFETASRGGVEWKVGEVTFRTRWAARTYVASADKAGILRDLADDGQVTSFGRGGW